MTPLHFASTLCYLPLKTDVNPDGVYSEQELYKVLSDLTIYVFSDSDPTKSFARRRDVRSSIAKLCKIVEENVTKLKTLVPVLAGAAQATTTGLGKLGIKTPILSSLVAAKPITGILNTLTQPGKSKDVAPLADYGVNLAKKLLATGKTPKDVAAILVGTACAFVGNTAVAVCPIQFPNS